MSLVPGADRATHVPPSLFFTHGARIAGRLKARPQDFVVRELPADAACSSGAAPPCDVDDLQPPSDRLLLSYLEQVGT